MTHPGHSGRESEPGCRSDWEGEELDFDFREQISPLPWSSPDGFLTADAGPLIVTVAAGLAESDTAGSTGPVTQGAPEPGTDEAGGD